MTRRTFIDEIQDPVTGAIHRIEAATEAELDAAAERYLEGDLAAAGDADDVQQASSDPSDPPVDPQPTNPA